MPLTPYTQKFKAAIMAKPKIAALINSKSPHEQEAILQAMFTKMLSNSLQNMPNEKKLEDFSTDGVNGEYQVLADDFDDAMRIPINIFEEQSSKEDSLSATNNSRAGQSFSKQIAYGIYIVGGITIAFFFAGHLFLSLCCWLITPIFSFILFKTKVKRFIPKSKIKKIQNSLLTFSILLSVVFFAYRSAIENFVLEKYKIEHTVEYNNDNDEYGRPSSHAVITIKNNSLFQSIVEWIFILSLAGIPCLTFRIAKVSKSILSESP